MLWAHHLTMPMSVILSEGDTIVHVPSVRWYLEHHARAQAVVPVHITSMPKVQHGGFVANVEMRRNVIDRIAAHLSAGTAPDLPAMTGVAT